MPENTLKSELLKNLNPPTTNGFDAEVARLHGIIDGEQRRVRRLARWTMGVWGVWLLLISIGLIVPILSQSSAPAPGTTQPVAVPTAQHHPTNIVLLTIGMVIGAQVFILPVVGVLLLIVLIFTRRSAGQNQIRASLAAIELQLSRLSRRRDDA